jgi:hypothetical protein
VRDIVYVKKGIFVFKILLCFVNLLQVNFIENEMLLVYLKGLPEIMQDKTRLNQIRMVFGENNKIIRSLLRLKDWRISKRN